VSTYTPIASVTLSSAQSSVTFSGIPQTYTDLVLVCSAVTASGGPSLRVRFNGDSGSNYSATILQGDGSSASSARETNISSAYAGYASLNQTVGSTNSIVHIMNYSNATTFKTLLERSNRSSERTETSVNLWRNTNAITSIQLAAGAAFPSENLDTGSTFNLYGVANASITNTAKATGGDSVTTDGTYWYHTFRTSGTFTPTQALTCDVLQIAGGGGGAGRSGYAGGAGGAGGVSYVASQSLTAQGYAVTIGAGGAGALEGDGSNGNNSQLGSLTAAVAGGAGAASLAGANGGSGGGGGGGSAPRAGGTGTAGQGNNGGTSARNGFLELGGGGGGGASATGANAVVGTSGGNGGAGTSTYSSWGLATGTGQNVSGTVWFAGGGGGGYGVANGYTIKAGGTGGNGGGATGSGSNGTAASATANTGGGGGGGSANENTGSIWNRAGSAGGSGIVIVRYAV
jgi:hypothetical protein